VPKKFVPEVGQIIYVNEQFWGRNKPNLNEYRVTKVNTVSVYAERVESVSVNGYVHQTRFNKRSMTSKDTFGSHYTAYETAEEYWGKVKLAQEKHEKTRWILKNIADIPMAGLEQIEEVIKAELGMK